MIAPTATLLTLTALCCLLHGGDAISWVRFDVPKYTPRSNDATLTCQFDLEGDTLYSVKWYKAGREFYRYVPKDWPPQNAFEQHGIEVDLDKSDHQIVVLKKVTLDADGRYKCEVLTEAPHFRTLVKSDYMHVVEIPDGEPEVLGGESEYRLGDIVNLTCTAPRSIPQLNLKWYINGQEVPQDYLTQYPTRKDFAGRFQNKLGLVFRAERWHFERDHVELRCTASIDTLMKTLYDKEAQHNGMVIHPLKPALLEDHTAGGGSPTSSVKLWLILLCSLLLHL